MNTKRLGAPADLRLTGLKLAGTGDGRFEGYASLFDRLDDQGDRVAPGAFAASLDAARASGRWPAMLWQHDPGEPIGLWERIEEDGRGLLCAGRLCLETRRGAEAHALMRLGALTGLSIGYRVLDAVRDDRAGQRRLTRLDLIEISPVTFPALADARVQRIKRGHSAALARAIANLPHPPPRTFHDR